MLHGRLAHLAQGGEHALRVDPRYGPFAAARDGGAGAQAALAALLEGPDDQLWLIEPEVWTPPPGTQVVRTMELLQMVADGEPPPPAETDSATFALGEEHSAEMAAIALATEPGPWRALTHRYGVFYGIHLDGRLAAMAGERMLPAPGLAEVSGVCTWPEYRGEGLARRLIMRVMAGQRARGDVPYLHSYAHNAGAIGLYESLGFRPRRTLWVTVLASA
ncbi:GNAT family N-acetyltransferase [Qipengyuania sp. RS5-5]|uniref:GNAT family N-acetyltransferase n=2 Tax=Parerythrobacter lacustris TaxID=2969984 RepID=A0ABT1XQW0_9SPHN|nr:GNAT family N-acetyltransferase [Parerythrobacter lacustris]MCR2833617.1 GNAT family N-acetyltransferase [Parerythrobacter lacustris]